MIHHFFTPHFCCISALIYLVHTSLMRKSDLSGWGGDEGERKVMWFTATSGGRHKLAPSLITLLLWQCKWCDWWENYAEIYIKILDTFLQDLCRLIQLNPPMHIPYSMWGILLFLLAKCVYMSTRDAVELFIANLLIYNHMLTSIAGWGCNSYLDKIFVSMLS